MAFLIDTNVISETLKPRPAARVIAWFGDQRSNDLFLASMSLGELVRGAHRVKDKVKRERFKRWIYHDLGRPIPGAHPSFRSRGGGDLGRDHGQWRQNRPPKTNGRCADRCRGATARSDVGHTQHQGFYGYGCGSYRSMETRRIFGVRAIIDPQALPPVVCLRRVGE